MKLSISLSVAAKKKPASKKPISQEEIKAHKDRVKKIKDRLYKMNLDQAALHKKFTETKNPEEKQAIQEHIVNRNRKMTALKVLLTTLLCIVI